jgi:cyclophilin family peptidyl-prolyl cis-trans isomerase/HEAT repeat protein
MVGQDEAIVEPLAAVLAAEDARRLDVPLFQSAVRDPSAVVRRHAALAMGRIGDRRAAPLLLELLTDPDSAVRKDAVFAIGILGGTTALDRVRELALITQPGAITGVHVEAVTAAARIGGEDGARVLSEVLNRWVGQATAERVPATAERALAEAWRLGDHAPAALLTQFAEIRDTEARRWAIYSLARLGAKTGATVLIRATDDADALIRSLAVQALNASLADSAGIPRNALATRVERLVADPDPHVRINALRALATFGGDEYVTTAADRAADEDPNVRVQALITLGDMDGTVAAEALRERLDGGIFATRYHALQSLARVVGAGAMEDITARLVDPDWRMRRGAVLGLGILGEPARHGLRDALSDPDPRVEAEALGALLELDGEHARDLATHYLDHVDPVVRSTAIGYFAGHPEHAPVDALVETFARGVREHDMRVQRAALQALGGVTDRSVASRLLARFPSHSNHQVREAAQTFFPVLAEQWGPARPVETGRSIADYRDIVREVVLPAERGTYRPVVTLETDRGAVILELFPATAPLTVWTFLEFVDRRFFDGNTWHRVVPNFVVQDGDRRGEGRGSAGIVLRDEVSRIPYDRGTLGLARSGPDTGGTQFFITLSPQPHLNGSYTVFGQVRSGYEALDRITFGDRIRRIRK